MALIPLREALLGGVATATPTPPPPMDTAFWYEHLGRMPWEMPPPHPDDAAGAMQMLEQMQAPMFPMPGATRMEPDVMSDAQGVYEQAEPHFDQFPQWFGPAMPRPLEFVTPRERSSIAEGVRIEDLMRLFPESFAVGEGQGALGPTVHHEQSETIQRADGKWVNVYGRATGQAGQPLPPRFPYERDAYDTVEEAVAAASRRSQDEGRLSPPPIMPQGPR